MHPTARHSATDCREIQKLAKRVSGRREQSSKDGSPPPRQRAGKEKASDSGAAAGEKELGYQSPARELKGVYHNDDSDSDNGDRRKKLFFKEVNYVCLGELMKMRLSAQEGDRAAWPLRPQGRE